MSSSHSDVEKKIKDAEQQLNDNELTLAQLNNLISEFEDLYNQNNKKYVLRNVNNHYELSLYIHLVRVLARAHTMLADLLSLEEPGCGQVMIALNKALDYFKENNQSAFSIQKMELNTQARDLVSDCVKHCLKIADYQFAQGLDNKEILTLAKNFNDSMSYIGLSSESKHIREHFSELIRNKKQLSLTESEKTDMRHKFA